MNFNRSTTFSDTSNCWLNVYRRSTSCLRRLASRVCRRARSESWLAITEVTKKASSATQFCVSAMVKVPTGGRKKKLKQSAAAMESGIAYRNPHAAATERTARKKVSATVVGLTRRNLEYTTTISKVTIAQIRIRNATR